MTLLANSRPTQLAVDELTGPRTLAGPGEYCLLCGDEMNAGEVYLFAQFAGRHGIAHESCLDENLQVCPAD